MRPHQKATHLLALCGFLAAAPAVAQGNNSFRELDGYISQAVKDWRIPGLAISIVQNGAVAYARGFGVRELGKPGAVDEHTRFAIGSTTKAMTALALGMLVDEGKLRWDDRVIDYLPDFRLSDPWVTRELTVRDLLTHRSGLGNADLLWDGGDNTTEEIVRRIRYLPLAYSFRGGFVYQNIMYAVAGLVIEKASGTSWESFLRTRIWQPLGMNETEPLLRDIEGKPNVASPHLMIQDTVRVITNRPVDAVKAAGAVWSSVADMARWMRFILDSGRVDGKRLVNPGTYQEIFTSQVRATPGMYPTTSVIHPHYFTYGLGWFLHDYQGETVWMHTGSIDGMSAIIGLLPDRRVGVYVLADLDHAELRHALMYKVFDLATGKPSRDWSSELHKLYGGLEAQERAAELAQQQKRAMNTRPSLPLASYAGTYGDSTFGKVVISTKGGGLHFEFGSGFVGDMVHWDYENFQVHWQDPRIDPEVVTFTPDGGGGVRALRAFGVTFCRGACR